MMNMQLFLSTGKQHFIYLFSLFIYLFCRSHMNQTTNLIYKIDNKSMGEINRWYRNLNHAELVPEYIGSLIELERSGVVIDRMLSICLLIE